MVYPAKALLKLILAFGVGMILTIWIFPTPGERYEGVVWGCWTGCWHGVLVVPNWVRSLFDETRLIKASSSSSWYDGWWWITMVCGIIGNYITPLIPKSEDD